MSPVLLSPPFLTQAPDWLHFARVDTPIDPYLVGGPILTQPHFVGSDWCIHLISPRDDLYIYAQSEALQLIL